VSAVDADWDIALAGMRNRLEASANKKAIKAAEEKARGR